MCFEIENYNDDWLSEKEIKKLRRPKIARKPIYVFKRGLNKRNGEFKSPIEGYIYKPKKLQKKVELMVSKCGDIDKGYHSYFRRVYEYGSGTLKGGLFVYPKGTRYFKNNDNNEIVGNQIKYIGPITELQFVTKYQKDK